LPRINLLLKYIPNLFDISFYFIKPCNIICLTYKHKVIP